MPTIFDRLIQLRIANLKRRGYFKPNCLCEGVETWLYKDEEIFTTKVESDHLEENNYHLILRYSFNGKNIESHISVVAVDSNLNEGKILLFKCPNSEVLCHNLHFYNGFFVHRSDIKHGIYSSQIRTKEEIKYDKLYGSIHKVDEAYDIIFSKYLKKHYRGKPTKRYLKAMKIIQEHESIDISAYEMACAFGIK